MINSNASKIKTYVGTDGKLHFVNSAGADTALNFSNTTSKLSTITGRINHWYGSKSESKGFVISVSYDESNIVKSVTISSGSAGMFGNQNNYTIGIDNYTSS